MPGDRRKEVARIKLRREAWNLGLEVGAKGHLESVGWVKSSLRELESQAIDLGMLDEVRRTYEKAKESGRQQRGKLTGTSASRECARAGEAAGREAEQAPSAKDDVIERISVKQGMKAMIALMKLARDNPEMKQRLNHLFAGISDVHDKMASVETEDDPRRTMEKALSILVDVGWLESYRIVSIDKEREEAVIEATSELARSFGRTASPICYPICNIFETVGSRSFGRSMVTIEDSCMVQGSSSCVFRMLPRRR